MLSVPFNFGALKEIVTCRVKKSDQFSKEQLPEQHKIDWFVHRTLKHRNLVCKYAEIIDELMGIPGLVKQVQSHDKSKMHEPELIPYIFITWGHKDQDYEVPDYIDKLEATRHHILNNSHHPECHDPSLNNEKAEDILEPEDRDWKPDKLVEPDGMPVRDLCECIADWAAMSEELGNNTVREWVDENVGEEKKCRWKFPGKQENFIYKVIGLLEKASDNGDPICN